MTEPIQTPPGPEAVRRPPTVTRQPVGATPPDDPSPDETAHLPRGHASAPWRLLDRLVVTGFAVALTIPAALLAAGIRPAAIENRPLLTPPPISAGALLDTEWYTAIDRFLADNVAVRPQAVRLRALVDAGVLGGTSNPAVVRGRDDWLFTIEELEPTCDLAPADVAAALDRTAERLGAAGRSFRFLAVPDKHAIYPDKRRADDPLPPACTDLARDAMRAEIAARPAIAVDGWTALLEARATDPDGAPLYYMQDSHWTPTGAVAGIRALVRSLDPALWDDADVVPDGTAKVTMDLARQLGIPRQEVALQLRVRPGVRIDRSEVAVEVTLRGARAVYRFTASGDRALLQGRTLVVYDSFFGINMARVAPFFAETTWVHVGDLRNHPELAAQLGPFDRVILERVERGLYSTDIDALLDRAVRPGG